MRMLCNHCNQTSDIMLHLTEPVESFASYKQHHWTGVCPACGQTVEFVNSPGPIAVIFSDDTPGKEHFMDLFDGKSVAGYYVFPSVNNFMHWWTDCIRENNIPGMWYHVMFGKKQICCGAMDPDDIECFRPVFPLELLDENMRAALGYPQENGLTIEGVQVDGTPRIVHLSQEQVELVYQHQEHMYRVEDARLHLSNYIRQALCLVADDISNQELDVQCAIRYGRTLTDMCCPGSNHYMLDYLASAFLMAIDTDTPENETWDTVIEQALTQTQELK